MLWLKPWTTCLSPLRLFFLCFAWREWVEQIPENTTCKRGLLYVYLFYGCRPQAVTIMDKSKIKPRSNEAGFLCMSQDVFVRGSACVFSVCLQGLVSIFVLAVWPMNKQTLISGSLWVFRPFAVRRRHNHIRRWYQRHTHRGGASAIWHAQVGEISMPNP